MAKRDYYEVLGVSKSASAAEIKKHIVNYQNNITQISTKSQAQKINSKRFLKRMKY